MLDSEKSQEQLISELTALQQQLDIAETARQQAEKALQACEARLRQAPKLEALGKY